MASGKEGKNVILSEIYNLEVSLAEYLGPSLTKAEIEEIIRAYKGRSHIRRVNISQNDLFMQKPVLPAINTIPIRIVFKTLSYAPIGDLPVWASCSNGLQNIIQSECFWQFLCKEHFNRKSKGLFNKSWKQLYFRISELSPFDYTPKVFIGYTFKILSPTTSSFIISIIKYLGGVVTEGSSTVLLHAGAFIPNCPASSHKVIMRYSDIIAFYKKFIDRKP